MSNNFVEAFSFIWDDRSLVISRLETHLLLSVESIAIALVIGLPLGVFLGHIHRFSFLAINVSNIGRALPSVAILAILLPWLGIGRSDVIIALVVLAFPPILTNTYVAVDGVDADTVDAAKGIGLTPLQVLIRVELPLALPLIFAGIRTSAVFVVATATLAGFFGGGGLGDIINNQESYHLSGVIGASYVLIVMAFIVQLLFLSLERAVTPAGLRAGGRRPGKRGGMGRVIAVPGEDGAQEEVDPDDEGAPSQGALAAVGNQLQQGRET